MKARSSSVIAGYVLAIRHPFSGRAVARSRRPPAFGPPGGPALGPLGQAAGLVAPAQEDQPVPLLAAELGAQADLRVLDQRVDQLVLRVGGDRARGRRAVAAVGYPVLVHGDPPRR